MKLKLLTLFLLMTLALMGCSAGSTSTDKEEPEAEKKSDPLPAPTPDPTIELSLKSNKDVAVDQKLSLTLKDGGEVTLEKVSVTGLRQGDFGKLEKKKVTLKGAVEGSSWKTNSFLEPNAKYKVVATLSDGRVLKENFTTQTIPLAKQTYPSLFPSNGSWGVAQPVVVRFDVPINDKAAIEKKLSIKTTPEQVGSWRWISAQEVRWRPKDYWKPGTRVKVNVNVNSVKAGKGIYGQFDAAGSFSIHKTARKAVVDLDRQVVKAFENGKLVKTIPVSTGKTTSSSSYVTRSGTKVIMSHQRSHRMTSGSIGIPDGSPESYDLVVQYAMRLTNSGEFFHAAPWNSAYFGSRGASHGCIGSSMENARWLYEFLRNGDPAEFHTKKGAGYPDRPMTVDNGLGDWSLSFADYKKGSAL